MLEIIVIIAAGKAFYQLANEHNRNKWLFAVLRPVFYFTSAFIFALVLAVLSIYFIWEIDFNNTILMSFILLPVGAYSTFLLYRFLKNKWEKEEITLDEIEDIGVKENE